MLAIYKRELRSYFTSLTGYFVICFFLLILGMYFWGINLSGQNPAIGETLGSISFVYTLALPFLTMRLLAEEQRQKTDQMLFSAPVSIWSVILGKYFAVVTVFTVPSVVICTMPVVLSQFGTVSVLKSYTSIFAFWMLGCVMLAIGLLISSMTDNQIVAAVASIAINVIILLMSSLSTIVSETAQASFIGLFALILVLGVALFLFIRNIIVTGAICGIAEAALVVVFLVKDEWLESALPNALSSISFYSRFYEFVTGTFRVDSIIYYISFIFLFLFLAMESVQKRRWS